MAQLLCWRLVSLTVSCHWRARSFALFQPSLVVAQQRLQPLALLYTAADTEVYMRHESGPFLRALCQIRAQDQGSCPHTPFARHVCVCVPGEHRLFVALCCQQHCRVRPQALVSETQRKHTRMHSCSCTGSCAVLSTVVWAHLGQGPACWSVLPCLFCGLCTTCRSTLLVFAPSISSQRPSRSTRCAAAALYTYTSIPGLSGAPFATLCTGCSTPCFVHRPPWLFPCFHLLVCYCCRPVLTGYTLCSCWAELGCCVACTAAGQCSTLLLFAVTMEEAEPRAADFSCCVCGACMTRRVWCQTPHQASLQSQDAPRLNSTCVCAVPAVCAFLRQWWCCRWR